MLNAIDQQFEIDDAGQIVERDRANWLWSQLKRYRGGKVRIRLSRPNRTSKANKYYWAGVVNTQWEFYTGAGVQEFITNVETGEVVKRPITRATIHELNKKRFLPPIIVERDQGEDVLPPSSARLDSKGFYWFVEQIRLDEMERGCYIMTPQEWEQTTGEKIRGGAIQEMPE